MSSRFFFEQPLSENSGDHAVLDGQEAHHLIHVMRARVGDEVTLFDGSGRESSAVINQLDRKRVQLEILKTTQVDRESAVNITIATALPKGDRQRVLIEKLTEIGVARFIPLISQRSVVQPKPNSLARLERVVIEASKQCGRNRLMKIESPVCIEELLRSEFEGRQIIAVPGGGYFRDIILPSAAPALCLVGPEGGFTEDEVKLAIDNGWYTVKLGKSILRAETASIALAAYLAISECD